MPDVLPSEEYADETSEYGSLRPGVHLGRYEILVPIARGGMARVWAARQHGQRGFQKLVAIKTILPHLALQPEFEKMFLDEARIASGVHHPNACEIYELGEENHTLYLAMEWVSGDSLSRALRASGRTEAIDPRVAARIIADACAGVHAAHELADDDGRELGVVHRDLSPHNVLLTGDGITKVCDFGVAKALGQLHESTGVGQLKGKLSYMSPEQVGGHPIDRRSDIFSLGCVLYEATTGVRPFRGDGDHHIIDAVLSGRVEPPTRIVPNYPPDLERIILRALSAQPILRYATAERMRIALEEFLARGPLVTHANVAHMVRSRLGDLIERRKEKIKQASSSEQDWSPASAPPIDPPDHRSGVKATQSRPLGIPSTREDRTGPPSLPGSELATVAARRPSGVPGPVAPDEDDATVHGHGAPQSGGPILVETVNTGLAPLKRASEPPTRAHSYDPGAANHPSDHVATSVAPPGSGPAPAHASASVNSRGPVRNPFASLGFDTARPMPRLVDPGGATAGQYVIAALVGILVAVGIAVGGFYIWQKRAMQSIPVEVAAPAPDPSPSTIATPTPAAASAVLPKPIELAVTPTDAHVIVDGRELAGRSIPRPTAGQPVTVLVRATGYEDARVELGSSSEATITITLRAVRAPAAVAAPPTTVKPHPKPRQTTLPSNPY